MANEVTAQRAVPEIVKFGQQLESKAEQIRMALPSHISPEKFQRTIVTTVQGDAELLKADRASLVLACMKAAQDGLLPDKREAAIVIFKENKKQADGSWQSRLIAQYLPMVYGLRKKILQSGDVVALEVNVVYRAEVDSKRFFYEVGRNPPLGHIPMLDLTEEQAKDSEIVAAYSIATMKDGTKAYELMRRFEIDRVRETSKTGATKDRNGKPRTPSGPWVDWFAEMAKKTVMRRHAKTLPQSGDIIIDVEGQEQDSALSAAALLASREPDQPLIEQIDADPPHDPDTGEIHDDDAPDQQEELKPKRTRRTKAQIEADEAQARADATEAGVLAQAEANREHREQEERDHNGGVTLAEEQGQASDEPDELQDDDGTLDDQMIVAEDLVSSFKKAETVIDLKRKYGDADEAIAAMPEHISSIVESAYQIELKRLKGGA
jgi:recombination protein RecT